MERKGASGAVEIKRKREPSAKQRSFAHLVPSFVGPHCLCVCSLVVCFVLSFGRKSGQFVGSGEMV